MKLQPIVQQLVTYLPFNTDKFTNVDVILEASAASGVATITTDTTHNLQVDDIVLITGVTSLVPITSIGLDTDTNQLTVRTASDHGLVEGFDFKTNSTTDVTVEMIGNSDPAYNGEFELLQVPNRYAFVVQLSETPIAPPLTEGSVLNYATNYYIGLKKITAILSSTEFQYDISQDAQENATGGKAHSSWRIGAAIEFDRAVDSYTKLTNDQENILEKCWLFVCPNDSNTASKDRNILNDSVYTARQNHQEFRQRLIDYTSLYVFVPTQNQLSAAKAFDTLEDIKVAIFQSFLRAPASPQYSVDADGDGFVWHFVSSSLAQYNKAYVVYEYIFATNYDLTYYDTFNAHLYSPFRNVEAQSIVNSGNYQWNVDLDVDPDF